MKRRVGRGAEQEVKKMAGVPDCVSSCGSTNMCHLNHLLAPSLPCVGEPTAASRVSPGSPARSEASDGAAAFYAADDKPDPEPEASAGRSTQMLLAMAANEVVPWMGVFSILGSQERMPFI